MINSALAGHDDVSQWKKRLVNVSLLSSREREVFLLLGNGSANREIAKRLSLSERTVKAHLTRIMIKLEVESRLQAGLVSCVYQLDARSSIPG
ncbi:helix-turn-helix transcriptional regulator [Micromonospora lupini]|uniref:response regulator transcription factor n=1 Tax=Micromonospora lupini TaxID=285679 RepID=UPI0033CAD495